MSREDAIEQLEYHNRWRQDVHMKSPDMQKVEQAIKTAIRLLREDKKIINFYEK